MASTKPKLFGQKKGKDNLFSTKLLLEKLSNPNPMQEIMVLVRITPCLLSMEFCQQDSILDGQKSNESVDKQVHRHCPRFPGNDQGQLMGTMSPVNGDNVHGLAAQ